jgi:hypothetical protein
MIEWRKSSRSVNNGACVEVGNYRKSIRSQGASNCVEVGSSDSIAVRDTTDREGPSLSFSPAAWKKFISSI